MNYLKAEIFLSNTYLNMITLDLSINEYRSAAHKAVFGVDLRLGGVN